MNDKNISRRTAVINTMLIGGLLGTRTSNAQTSLPTSITVVDTFDDLATTPATDVGMIIYLRQHTRNDLGGGYFQDNEGTIIADGGTIINNSVTSNRYWKRIDYDYATPQMFGAVGDGDNIDTVAIQSALNSGKNVISPSGFTYRTDNTLFLTKDNIVVDFNGSKILNKNNSAYAIVIVTSSIDQNNENRLLEVMNELHYGNEAYNSHIKNLIVEMSSINDGGGNLGVGIVYGRNCTLSNITVLMTNGNGIEIRNSTACGAMNSRLNPRTYGAFFFQTKDCYMEDVYISGCHRGIITKHSQAGSSVNFRATRCIVENLVNHLYYTAGGEWKENLLTDPIYQPNHEIVSDVLYENCVFRSNNAPVKVDLSYWANRFTYSNCSFISGHSSAGANIGLNGNYELGDMQGKAHKFVGCNFVNQDTVGDTSIACGADTLFDSCTFTGSYQRLIIADNTFSPVIQFANNLVSASLQTSSTSNKALLVNSDNSIFIAKNNIFKLGLAPSSEGASSAISFNLTAFDCNIIRVFGMSSLWHVSVYIEHGSAHNNNMYYSDFNGDVHAFYIYGTANVQNNIIGNNGIMGPTSRAIYMVSHEIEVVKNEGNYVYGLWQYQQYANLYQNYQLNRRFKEGPSIPTNGTWQQGDVVFNSNPSTGHPIGWICVSSGAPGSWTALPNLI